ncbi:hypothetical protein POM88_051264 [Heracleum sosnowskyi]|uniref:Uncharacterized protein n=1 Tax=Heracleum sosnowskyi TaxID=360622 RepID=A0AAD8M3K0_9APIA|nr:hypothetical protein POM88_051264 [Heracleum sosnowskyi]
MSKFIDLVETFDFTALHPDSYGEKIDGLLERFPKYENDDHFRTVLPSNFAKTADDYISMKFCTIGRFPVYGIYDRRDLDLVAVCVERIMYALDDCDLHGSFVPDLQVRKVHLGIQYTPLATRETLNYLRNCLCSAISTISLGYTPEKKNEWCEAIVLLTGMTSQAVRFHEMKEHVQFGLYFGLPYDTATSNGRYELSCGDIAMQYRWNKISKAIRRGEYPYVFSHYADRGTYSTHAMCEDSARDDVSLINDKDKTKAGKYCRKRINKWNGPLENSKRNREEESHRRSFLEREMVRKQLMDKKLSERMHGAWYGSLDTLKYEVASVNCLPTPAQMVRANRFLVSATPPLDCLQGLLHVQTSVASIYLAAKSIRNEGGLLTYFRGWGVFVIDHIEFDDSEITIFMEAALSTRFGL